jgi:hypothetical protein
VEDAQAAARAAAKPAHTRKAKTVTTAQVQP